ncbi:hypothetical protein ACFL5V_10390 [Fibrobacterota bacterium]
MKNLILFLIMMVITGSCIPDEGGPPFENFRSYALEAIKNKEVIGVGQLIFLMEEGKGFIFYNLYTVQDKSLKTPVKSSINLIEVSEIKERKIGMYIIIGKHFKGYSVVGTVRRGPSAFPILEDTYHTEFQLTIQEDDPHFIRPLSKHGLGFYQRYLSRIDLGQSPDFTEYKFSQ